VAKVFNHAPDGYTVLVGTPTELILSPLTIPSVKYGPADFRMVGLWGRVPYILVARADLPYATLADLLASKNKPGTKPLSVGNIGPGSLIHLLGVQFARVAGLDTIQVNFQGVPPLVQNLLGSQVDLGFIPINGSTMALIEQGKLRSLGITAPEPFPVFPLLKPLAAGSPVFAGFNYDVWGGMHVHKSVPIEVQQRLNQIFYEVCSDPDFREYARSTGSALLPPMNLAELDKMYVADTLRYQALSKSVPL
jgi:tripartite-type tricarboxylate transporter receptor subunit TctC